MIETRGMTYNNNRKKKYENIEKYIAKETIR